MSSFLCLLLCLLLLCGFTPAFAAPTAPDKDFTENGDGTVTHKITGLTWKRCAEEQTWMGNTCTGDAAVYTYDQALKLTSNFAGKNDWRLPNIAELKTIVERESYKPAINTTVFPNTTSDWFWSASVYAYDPNRTWGVHFGNGNDGYGLKSDGNAVRLVRGGQSLDPLGEYTPTQDFTDHGNGTVTHKTTDLMWQRCAAGQTWAGNICMGAAAKYTYKQALQLISTLAGRNDWRLPTANELETLVEYKNTNPAINSTIFPNTPSDWFWSASVYANDSSHAWGVFFVDGYDHYGNEFDNYAVRLVRGRQSLDPLIDAPNQKPTPTPEPANSGEGYIEGQILDACSHKPLAFVDVQVGQRTQQTDKDGNYKLKLPFGEYKIIVAAKGYQSDKHTTSITRDIKPNAFEDFRLAPPGGPCALPGRAYSYKAIIVAGSGPYLGGGKTNHVWDSTRALTGQAYLALRQQGFAADRIRYLSAAPQSQDVDKDNVEDITGEATLDNLQAALTWAGKSEGDGDVQDVVLYLIGHGYADQGSGYFLLNRNKTLSSSELKPGLDALQSKITGILSVIIDACYSGSFIKPLATDKRFVITSTKEDRNAVLSNKGIDSFSNHFWKKVGLDGGQLGAGFTEARQAMSHIEVDNNRKLMQDAQVDADGSGDFNAVDADIIGQYCYGACKYPEHLAVAPEINGVGPDTDLGGQRSRHLSVQADKAVDKAWVNIQRPDYHYPTDGTALASFLRVELSCQGNSCGDDYHNFNLNGEYNVTFYVQDAEGNVATPHTLTLQQSGFNAPLNSRKKAALAVYEPETGVLALKDVEYQGQHYYVELRDADQAQGGYAFALSYLQTLNEQTVAQAVQFDGSVVSIPEVLVEGQGFAGVKLRLDGGMFRLQ